jgi:hypothetical protein
MADSNNVDSLWYIAHITSLYLNAYVISILWFPGDGTNFASKLF